MADYTDEELAGLTAEEREALLGDEDAGEIEGKNPGVTEEAAATEDEGDGDAETDEGAEGDDNAADGAGSDDGNGNDDAADNADTGNGDGQADADQPAQSQAPAPVLIAEAPADAKEKLDAIATSKNDLLEKFDNGDITTAEYHKELDKLNRDEREIERAVDKAQLAVDMETQRLQNAWHQTHTRFFAQHTRYDAKTNPRLFKAMDEEVKAIALSDQFKNRNDEGSWVEILETAHKNLAAEFGYPVEAPGAKPGAKPAPKAKAAPNLPPNLSKVPTADMNDTGGGEFASLDRLANSGDAEAYEAALASLSPTKLDAYLQR